MNDFFRRKGVEICFILKFETVKREMHDAY
jgi:hypothetical protein